MPRRPFSSYFLCYAHGRIHILHTRSPLAFGIADLGLPAWWLSGEARHRDCAGCRR
jgi:hypothetical protein